MNTDEGDYREAYQRWYHEYNRDPREMLQCFKYCRFVPFERPEPSKTIEIGPMQIGPYRQGHIQPYIQHEIPKESFDRGE